jgi:hypothetical protein
MAGVGNVASAAKRRGASTTAWETDHDGIDCTLPWVSDLILGESERGILGGVWLGLVSTSWSASRMRKPVRHWHHSIWGLPGLDAKLLQEVILGNKQARWAARLFTKLAVKGIPVAIENPSSSLLWFTPLFRCLLARFGFRDVDMCSFGSPYRKRTRILFANWKLQGLSHFCCHGKGGMCSFTGRRHIELTGGEMTKPAELFRYVVSCL